MIWTFISRDIANWKKNCRFCNERHMKGQTYRTSNLFSYSCFYWTRHYMDDRSLKTGYSVLGFLSRGLPVVGVTLFRLRLWGYSVLGVWIVKLHLPLMICRPCNASFSTNKNKKICPLCGHILNARFALRNTGSSRCALRIYLYKFILIYFL